MPFIALLERMKIGEFRDFSTNKWSLTVPVVDFMMASPEGTHYCGQIVDP